MQKVRVGVVGLRRGAAHLRSLLRLDQVEIIGAADRLEMYRDRAKSMAAEFNKELNVLNEYDDLLELKPDLIYVATNNKQQCEHSCMAMEAGCGVVSEVPGAYTYEEWVQIRNTVLRTGQFYMMGENSCFLDFLRYWRKWYLDGRFGEISIAEAEYLHHLPNTLMRPDGTVLSPSTAKLQGITDAQPVWRADQPPIQYLTHDLGPILEVLDDRCVSVSCVNAPNRNPDAPLRVDGQIALFTTAKGFLVKVMITLDTARPFEHRYYLYGVEGSAEWFEFEKYCRRFMKDRTRPGWEKIPIGHAAAGDQASGHGGTDFKVSKYAIAAFLNQENSPIDVFRSIEYSLPGIIANHSAELGGAPLPIPDLRTQAYAPTRFWDIVGLPEKDPEPLDVEQTATVPVS